eukprot:gene13309-biopygen13697
MGRVNGLLYDMLVLVVEKHSNAHVWLTGTDASSDRDGRRAFVDIAKGCVPVALRESHQEEHAALCYPANVDSQPVLAKEQRLVRDNKASDWTPAETTRKPSLYNRLDPAFYVAAKVILPLVNLTPPKSPSSVRRVDPIVCLTTEIFGPDLGEQEIIDIHCKELLDYGFIEPAAKHCKHASNVVVAGKQDHETGLWTQTRFCVDLRGINRHSLKDTTLPHRPEELYQKVARARFKTTLDATKAFHQIPMATEEDRNKTAFWWKNQVYQYTSMPFGAAGATSAFVRIMDYELRHLQYCTVAYVDDVVVYTDSTPEQHLKDVEEVLRTLGDAGIRLHAGKSTFGAAGTCF